MKQDLLAVCLCCAGLCNTMCKNGNCGTPSMLDLGKLGAKLNAVRDIVISGY